ncbi:hypothetical protein KSP40_PGU002260 [Platanthera guangdongensis]|uniref:Uncharacterized protein n=1 Tax=Platanthera guangdongensis TaxID=2320717 RepID=A0ABR2MV70_9ASPA
MAEQWTIDLTKQLENPLSSTLGRTCPIGGGGSCGGAVQQSGGGQCFGQDRGEASTEYGSASGSAAFTRQSPASTKP